MIQIYADGALAYDSRLEEYDLRGLKITKGLNKGGTAEITMPAEHPAYGSFIGYRTIVEIYRDAELRFRGRSLYLTDDFENTRTVVCEGELCFLQDGVSRPYLYQDTPRAIFEAVVAEYNAQVDPFKQFKVGKVTVTDPNDYIRLESEDAEAVLATVNKLLERCGGYIVFTTDGTGAREINWLASVGTESSQLIEAGENLFDFQSTGANTDLATALIPYGAKDETTGKRITIESVNGGLDYIKDDAAAALRGLIYKTAVWDDVTEPANLLTKARQYLNECKLYVTSLTLSALDLSYIDKSIESFKEGDFIRVLSDAHGVNETFQLVERSEDLLNPAGSYITLGKEIRTLTGLDVAGDNKSQSDIKKSSATLKKEVESNLNETVGGTKQEMNALIEQQAASVLARVAEEYATKESLSGFATKTSLEDYVTKEEQTEEIAKLTEEITRLTERIAALEAAQ